MTRLFTLFRICFLLFCLFSVIICAAAENNALTPPVDDTSSNVNPSVELAKLQQHIDTIKGQVSGDSKVSQLDKLNEQAGELTISIDTFLKLFIPQQTQLESQLAVLGSAPKAESRMQEAPDVTHKRRTLENQKRKLDDQIKQAKAIKANAQTVSIQIIKLRRDALRNQLALNSGSIFSQRFWSPLFDKQNLDSEKINDFWHKLAATTALSWEKGWRIGTIIWLLSAILIVTMGRYYLETFFAWLCTYKMPEGRLRRSFFAVSVVMSTLVAIVLALNFINLALTRRPGVSNIVHKFFDSLIQLSVLCGLIAGLGRVFLSTRRSSWRLPAFANPIALALKPFPPFAALLVFLFQAIESFNDNAGTGVGITILLNGLTALLISAMALAISFRIGHTQRKIIQNGHQHETRSTLVGLIQIAITLTGVAIVISLVIGHIILGRFLSYELIWIGIVTGLYYLLSHLIIDICDNVFSVRNATGQYLKKLLNIDERYLLQATALFSALGKIVLMLFAGISLLYDTLGLSTSVELLQKVMEIWGGKGLELLNIVPAHLVNALLCLVAGIYALRAVRRWLNEDFLPKTTMEVGMCLSLVTLFSNVGYVLVVLLTLSVMGVQWDKLAWIVSALSVGIGFGLQEIVKNFIAGLILLTERPVKVGDLVSIGGIEGDIRSINVRATEIQLGDKSTVIVPNSQLISQNVRNVTMGKAQGVATITLTFPLDIDPERVREILLDVLHENKRVLDAPAPSVSFKDLVSEGIVLSVTGNVTSPRQVAGTKSDLLFEILRRLRQENVRLSIPQTMVIERKKRRVGFIKQRTE